MTGHDLNKPIKTLLEYNSLVLQLLTFNGEDTAEQISVHAKTWLPKSELQLKIAKRINELNTVNTSVLSECSGKNV